jgi:hypothetical protein
MYKISDFSKITNLSVKALRYYDEEGILTPSCRDSATGYRYYSGKISRELSLWSCFARSSLPFPRFGTCWQTAPTLPNYPVACWRNGK